MADVKISGLPASTVPLAGTEVLPIVQSGATKQVSIANVTAGRSVAALSVITPTIQAEAGSAGGTIKNGSGVAQMQWGSGGASNLSLEVATNINPANAAVSISPTGTGTVAISPAGALTINPTAASTMNNVAIGATTPLTGSFTTVKAATTIGVGAATPAASGAGITFPATQSTSTDVNTLDDYEEGTWTPLLESDGGSAAGKTYTTQLGTYTKIGNVVYYTFVVTFSDKGSSNVNEANLRGLPFTVASQMTGYMQSWANVGTNSLWFGLIPRSTTTTYVSTLTAAGTSTSLYVSSNYQNNTSFTGGGFYYV
jgi:hypothetical protein